MYYPIFNNSEFIIYVAIDYECHYSTYFWQYIFIVFESLYRGIMRFSQFWQLCVLPISDRFHRLYGTSWVDSPCIMLHGKNQMHHSKTISFIAPLPKKEIWKRIKSRKCWKMTNKQNRLRIPVEITTWCPSF